MYNPEALYYTENDLSFADDQDLESLLETVGSFEISEEELMEETAFFDEEELIDEQAFFDDEEIGSAETYEEEADLFEEEAIDDETELTEFIDESYPEERMQLEQLAEEINLETIGMDERETAAYMESRMAEFFPALAAALPAIIQLAPQAVNAVKTLIGEKPKPKPTAAVVTAPPPPPTPSPVIPAPPVTDKKTSFPVTPLPAVDIGDPASMQMLKVLTELIQSPRFLELLKDMLAGKSQTVITDGGQQISGSNVLGVISSLAGTLAGTASPTKESFFPGYAMSNEGTFIIDPHDAAQEAALIVDMIN